MIDLIAVLAIITAIFMSISIGASAAPPAFGPVTSSRSSGVLRSALLAGLAAALGAILQGSNVTTTISSGIVYGGISTLQAFAILLVSSILVIASVITKYPMPTAFTIVGAVIGSALSFGNSIQVLSVRTIVLYWILIPFLALGISYIFSKSLRYFLDKEKTKTPIKYLTLMMGLFVAYTSGANSVGLAVGPLQSLDSPMIILLVMGGASILVGALVFSPKIIDAVSFEYSNIGPRRSVAALGTAAILAQIGIFFGIPISFNEAIIMSIIGSGLVIGKKNIGKRKLIFTGGAWISAFFISIAVTYTLGEILQCVQLP